MAKDGSKLDLFGGLQEIDRFITIFEVDWDRLAQGTQSKYTQSPKAPVYRSKGQQKNDGHPPDTNFDLYGTHAKMRKRTPLSAKVFRSKCKLGKLNKL